MHPHILTLTILSPCPHQGYEMKKAIDRSMGGMVSLNNKTLYLTLKRSKLAPTLPSCLKSCILLGVAGSRSKKGGIRLGLSSAMINTNVRSHSLAA
jgi:hypothetical protein